ncbi:hypothetical protein ABZ250_17135 [Streptomyces afghaniensis]|jgi:hypothetical protein|uniref:Uncharacterized protein n=1 Tax=Streptomyces afghaniensis 772 TaxID=1283301 RepID=S4N9B3_9ACTN|nr:MULTISPECIES: hypothetical protein [Streptomyces]EPJ34244.1 hypothetical protein STAFG_8704 [Streptomyces afghaniensis 772]UOB10474.1 hypothetical protein MQE23_15985 [Streptomyces sp. HP-A2021]
MDADRTPTRTRSRARDWRRLRRAVMFSAVRGAAAALGSGAVSALLWWWQR